MVSQSSACLTRSVRVQRLIAQSVVCLATLSAFAFAPLKWTVNSAIAAPSSERAVTTRVAFLNDRANNSAANLGTAVATDLPAFRQRCATATAATQPNSLCLSYTYGGSLDGELTAADELPGETTSSVPQPEAISVDSATNLQPIDPYQYDKVQLFPLQ